jgi:hypothetical protein
MNALSREVELAEVQAMRTVSITRLYDRRTRRMENEGVALLLRIRQPRNGK